MISKFGLWLLVSFLAVGGVRCEPQGCQCGKSSPCSSRKLPMVPIMLDNCGPDPSPLPPINAPSIQTPLVNKPTMALPAKIPPTKTIGNSCRCVKTVVKPQVVQQLISVPSVQRFIETTHTPVVEHIHYEGVPINCPPYAPDPDPEPSSPAEPPPKPSGSSPPSPPSLEIPPALLALLSNLLASRASLAAPPALPPCAPPPPPPCAPPPPPPTASPTLFFTIPPAPPSPPVSPAFLLPPSGYSAPPAALPSYSLAPYPMCPPPASPPPCPPPPCAPPSPSPCVSLSPALLSLLMKLL